MPGRHQITSIDDVAALLDGGAVVAVPTESFFALAARVDRPEALERLARLKQGRAAPIGLMAPDAASLTGLVADVPPLARGLIEMYWPGALTIVLPAAPGLSPVLTGGGGTIGIRVPDHPVLLSLLHRTGPLTATSANRPGAPPAVSVADVEAAFPGLPVWRVVERAPGGSPSTVVDATGASVRVLRQGAVRLT